MNTPQQARPTGNRDRVARHARAGPESVLSSIPQQSSPEAEVSLPQGQPGQRAQALQLPSGQPVQALPQPPGQLLARYLITSRRPCHA